MRTTISALALILAAAPALAQVTADQVWDQIVAVNARLGVDLIATPVRDGATVVLGEIVGRWPVPMGFGTLAISVSDVTLTEQGDGSVLAELAADGQMVATLDWGAGSQSGQVVATVDIDTVNHRALITGAPGDMTIVTTADRYAVSLADLSESGSTAFGEVVLPDVFLQVEGTQATTRISGTDPMMIDITSSTARVVTDFGMQDDFFSSKAVNEIRDTAATISIALPDGGIDVLNLSHALRRGLAVSLTGTNGLTRAQTVSIMGDELFQDQTQTIGTTSQSFALDQTGVRLDGIVTDYAMSVMLVGMPEAIDVRMDEGTFGMSAPLLANGMAQAAGFNLSLTGLDPSSSMDMIFGTMATDFGGKADLAVEVTAMVTPRQDLLDLIPLVEDLDRGNLVVELNDVAVPLARLHWEDATVEGSGEAHFDWAGVMDYGDMRPPTAAAQYQMTGLTALIGRLAEAGVIPSEEVFMIQGGLAMVAIGSGEDAYRGEIALDANGTVTLNGAPLPF